MTVKEILETKEILDSFQKIYEHFLALETGRGDENLWNEFKNFEQNLKNSSIEIKIELLDNLQEAFNKSIKNFELDLVCRKILALLRLYLLE